MRTAGKVFWFLAFGLLPLWLGLAYLVFIIGSGLSGKVDPQLHYAWLLFVVALVLCPVTLALTGLTVLTYRRTQGSDARKTAMAATTLVVSLAVLATTLVTYRKKQMREAVDLKAEQGRAVALVLESDSARRFAGPAEQAQIELLTIRRGEAREHKIYWPDSSAKVYAIVRTDPQAETRGLTLACLTPLSSPYDRRPDESCEHADEQMQVLEFAISSDRARRAAGARPQYRVLSPYLVAADGAIQYTVQVQGEYLAYAIVRVDRGKQEAPTLACITPTRPRDRHVAAADACANADERLRALVLARDHPEVRRLASTFSTFALLPDSPAAAAGGSEYNVSMSRSADAPFYAVVRGRAGDPSTLTVGCVTALAPDKRNAAEDVCARDDAFPITR